MRGEKKVLETEKDKEINMQNKQKMGIGFFFKVGKPLYVLYVHILVRDVLHSWCYSVMHIKDKPRIAALFIVSPLHCKPQEVLACTDKARETKKENMFLVSLPLFISSTRGNVPR